jgi:SAM-dependent methyltransferase
LIHDLSQGIPFQPATYDFVFCLEVLEHVTDPFRTLAEMHRVLRPGGILVVSVPNPYHFKEIIWNMFRIPDRQGHFFGWTWQTMTRLAETSGFRPDAIGGTYLHPPIPMIPLFARSSSTASSKSEHPCVEGFGGASRSRWQPSSSAWCGARS